MAKIPVDIIGDNEVKILEYLPEPSKNEMEDAYLSRCVPVLYPEYYDQEMATALCADKLQRKTTVTNLKKEISKLMKQTKQSSFDRKMDEFRVALAEAELRASGIELQFAEQPSSGAGSFPWEECQAKMMEQYGDKDIADKVCGMIKSKYGS